MASKTLLVTPMGGPVCTHEVARITRGRTAQGPTRKLIVTKCGIRLADWSELKEPDWYNSLSCRRCEKSKSKEYRS